MNILIKTATFIFFEVSRFKQSSKSIFKGNKLKYLLLSILKSKFEVKGVTQ